MILQLTREYCLLPKHELAPEERGLRKSFQNSRGQLDGLLHNVYANGGDGFCREAAALQTVINLNQRVPADHPLRGIKERTDKVLAKLSALFDELYAKEGRPSIPPEQLLKSRILIALTSPLVSTAPATSKSQ